MAILQMQRISICALKRDQNAIIESLQSLGAIEINKIIRDDITPESERRVERTDSEKKKQITEQALDVLDQYVPIKEGIFSSLEGKRIVKKHELDALILRDSDILFEAEALKNMAKEIAESKAEIIKRENLICSIDPWIDLDIPLDFAGTDKTDILIGAMPPETDLESIYQAIAEGAPDSRGAEVEIVSSDNDAAYICVVLLKEDRRDVEEALRIKGFVRTSVSSSKTPRETADDLENEIESINAKIDELKAKISTKSEVRNDLRALGDYYRMKSKEYEIAPELINTESTFVVSGYITKNNAEKVKDAISRKYECAVDIEEIGDDEVAPTVLKNNAVSSSMESIVESYGLPERKGFDPTTIMSWFYIFFFGLMLSDAGYGLIMAIGCFVLLKKYPNMTEGTHKMLKLFGLCGVSTVFWGVMFSGYFGDAPTVIAKVFFNKEFSIPPLWFAPLNNPMKLLIWCMGFGVIHLFVGLAIKGYLHLKAGKYLDFLCDVVFWYMLLTGLILMLLPTEIFSSISQMNIVLPGWLQIVTKILVFGGMIGILLMSGRGRQNFALRLALGAYDIYGVSSWLSDVLSYSRLLALGLATGVIGSVVNMMGGMIATSILGKIAFIIIFAFGHTLNMAINLLGAYVHTNRLQYVEFFSKFYEAGGKPFEPLTADSKYIEIKEEF